MLRLSKPKRPTVRARSERPTACASRAQRRPRRRRGFISVSKRAMKRVVGPSSWWNAIRASPVGPISSPSTCAGRVRRSPIEVVAGDLRPGFGQGLLFSRTSRNGARDWRLRADHRRLGYRSSGENDAFRGLGVRGRAGLLSWALLGGRGRRDARVDEHGNVTSLPSSGIHVTKVERRGHSRLGLRVFGARVRGDVPGASVGLVGQEIRFDRWLDLRHKGRKGAAFHGRRTRAGSADLLLKQRNLDLAGAVAVDGSSRFSTSMVLRLGLPRGRVVAGWRKHRAGFANPFGRTSNGGNNETGVGGEWTGGIRRLKWRLAVDQHRQPQAEYTSPLPKEALRWSGELETRVGRQARLEAHLQTDGRRRDHTRRFRLDLHLRGAKLRVEGRLNRGANSDRGGLVSALWRYRWRHLNGVGPSQSLPHRRLCRADLRIRIRSTWSLQYTTTLREWMEDLYPSRFRLEESGAHVALPASIRRSTASPRRCSGGSGRLSRDATRSFPDGEVSKPDSPQQPGRHRGDLVG